MTPIAHYDLSDCNTFGMCAHAAWGFPFTSLPELQALLAEPRWAALPRLVLGGGSNVLFTCDFEGLILLNRLRGIAVREDATHWHLRVAAGENWHELVTWSLAQGMPGLENMALIPGAVGAAPVQNIGAYGVEFCRYCDYVEAWNIPEARLETIPAAECGFGYRESHFKGKWQATHIITAVGLSLPKQWQPVSGYGPLRELGDKPSPQAIFDEVCRLRLEKLPQPEVLGNAGSFFKNPCVTAEQADALTLRYPAMPRYPQADGQVKLAAGWLIEQAGLKGHVQGRAAVHAQQALVLVNLGGATAQEIMALARLVQQRVHSSFAVQLEPEVRFIGQRAEVKLDEVEA
ncbi:MAG: UDP-N-acetylmuramate dehydrogenase [Aeromonadaceae bacterium]